MVENFADVAIELDLKSSAVLDFYNDYLRLLKMGALVKIYNDLKKYFPLFLHLFNRIKKEGLNKQHIAELLQNHNKLEYLTDQLTFYHDRIYELKSQKSSLEREINYLREKRDNYDGISPL
jgi:predicted metal-dependent hydrolase